MTRSARSWSSSPDPAQASVTTRTGTPASAAGSTVEMTQQSVATPATVSGPVADHRGQVGAPLAERRRVDDRVRAGVLDQPVEARRPAAGGRTGTARSTPARRRRAPPARRTASRRRARRRPRRAAGSRGRISSNRGAAHGRVLVAEDVLQVDDDEPALGGHRGQCLLGAHRRTAQRQGAEQPDQEGGEDAEVGEGPVAVLAAQPERLEQVALPVQPAGEGVGDQAPADERCRRRGGRAGTGCTLP